MTHVHVTTVSNSSWMLITHKFWQDVQITSRPFPEECQKTSGCRGSAGARARRAAGRARWGRQRRKNHKKLSNFGHHNEFDVSGVSIKDIQECIEQRIVNYDHQADKTQNNKYSANYKLQLIEDKILPKYLINNKETKQYYEGSGVCAYSIHYSKIKDIYVYYYPGDEGCHNGEYKPPPDNFAGRITLTNNPDERYGWDDAIENVMCFYK